MRTTLLIRLKSEFKVGLEKSEDKWEPSINSIHKTLGKLYFYSDLTIAEILSIWLFSDVKGVYDRDGDSWKYGGDMFELENGCI